MAENFLAQPIPDFETFMNLQRLCLLIVCSVFLSENLLADASSKPNVLFIAIDDLNDWVGFLDGHAQAKTPNMDRLASRGVVFSNAHCQAPICNPSRVSLLTGTLPSTNGIYLLSPTDFRKACPLLKDANETPTLPEHFAANGYRQGKRFRSTDHEVAAAPFLKTRSATRVESNSGTGGSSPRAMKNRAILKSRPGLLSN